MLNQASGQTFHNTSRFTFQKLLDDPENIAANLNNIINNFSDDAREIFVDKFELPLQIARLVRWSLDRFAPFVRPAALVSPLFGGFLIYAAV